jgi:hypothetical protein
LQRTPLPEPSDTEQRLTSDEIAALPFRARVTELASKWNDESNAIINETEVVSRSDDFGYVFRYKMLASGEFGSLPPSTLVLYTRDFLVFSAATFPGFNLDHLLPAEKT